MKTVLDKIRESGLNENDILEATTSLAQAVGSAIQGRPLESVGHALDAVMAIVPYESLAPYLSDAAIRRQKRIKDIADAAKFGT